MAKKPPFKYPTQSRATLGSLTIKAILTVIIAVGMLSLLVWLAKEAGQQVANKPRYDVLISAIEVTPPAGLDKPTFLTEVRAHGSLAESVSAVAQETPGQLAAAFAKHPWVESVSRVSVKPERTIVVELEYRKPILAVPVLGDPTVRLIDKSGVLLPITQLPEGITVLRIDTPFAAGPAGQVVSNETIKRAAELCDIYKDNKPKLIEKTKSGWRITTANGPNLTVSW